MQEKFEQAIQHDIATVTPFWVLDCIDCGKLLAEEDYCPLPPEEDDPLSLHVETISVSTLPAQEDVLPNNQRTDTTELQTLENEPLSGNAVHVNGTFKCSCVCLCVCTCVCVSVHVC